MLAFLILVLICNSDADPIGTKRILAVRTHLVTVELSHVLIEGYNGHERVKYIILGSEKVGLVTACQGALKTSSGYWRLKLYWPQPQSVLVKMPPANVPCNLITSLGSVNLNVRPSNLELSSTWASA